MTGTSRTSVYGLRIRIGKSIPIVSWALAAIIFVSPISPLPAWAGTEKTKKKDAEPLHKLVNEELLKQARTIFETSHGVFLAEIRNLTKSEILLVRASRQTQMAQIPEEKPPEVGGKSAAEIAKLHLEHAKARLDAYKRKLELIQAEKKLLDRHIENVEAAQSGARAFADAIGHLNMYLLEIRLRTEDGSLSYAMIPPVLSGQELEKRTRELATRQRELKEEFDEAQKAIAEIALRTEEIKKAVIDAEAVHSSVREKNARETKRESLEKEYAGQTPERLIAQVAGLQEERLWFNGALNISRLRFNKSAKYAGLIREEFEEMVPPETETAKLREIRPEEAFEAAALVEKIVAYHGKRIEKVKELADARETMIKQGESLQGDITVMGEHLFKMQVAAKVLDNFVKQEKIAPDSVPAGINLESLVAEGNRLADMMSETMAVVQNAKKKLAIDKEAEKSETARNEAKARLAGLEKAHEAAKRAREWEAELKDRTVEEIVENFRRTTETLQKNFDTLQKKMAEFGKANKSVREARQKLESLKDPFLRSATEESFKERQDILKDLFGVAGMEPPKEKAGADMPSEAAGEQKPDAKAPEKKEQAVAAAKPEDEKDKPESEAVSYLKTLSTRARIISEKKKHRTELLNALKTTNQRLEEYLALLTDTGRLVQQYHANAVEIKKRVGRGQIGTDQIPDELTKALKRDMINRVETETARNLNYKTFIRQEIERFGKEDETLNETEKLLNNMRTLVGRRLDTFKEISKLEQDFSHKFEDLAKTEQKTVEQSALRRLKSQDTLAEMLLGFIRSEEIDNLTGLMQSYYMELTELEKKLENLYTQNDKTENLVRIAEKEKSAISELLPILQKQIGELEIGKEEERVKIRIQLAPDKAEKIIGAFEAKTGRRVSPPAPIPEEYRKTAIEKAAKILFNKHVEIVAAKKWIDLFRQRLSSKGIDTEIGRYQERLGDLNARDAAIQRRILYISGRPVGAEKSVFDESWPTPAEKGKPIAKSGETRGKEEPAKTEAEKPAPEFGEKPPAEPKKPVSVEKTATESAKSAPADGESAFEEGEIGMLREDRYYLGRQLITVILVKMAVAIVIAILFSIIAGRLFSRMIKRSKEKSDSEYAPFLALIRKITLFSIWGIAFIAGLDIIGFDVGAILAGLGIGGFAIAFAVKGILGDIFGGITIMLVRPFKVGDKIDLNGTWCIVREIGIRYCTLEDFSYNYNHIVPNSILTESEIINISTHPGYTILTNVRLSTRNNADKIKQALELVKKIITDHPGARFIWVKHDHFDDFSFVLRIHYDINEFKERASVETDVNAEIVRRFQQNDIEFTPLPLLPPAH